jgi:hypothetical protein
MKNIFNFLEYMNDFSYNKANSLSYFKKIIKFLFNPIFLLLEFIVFWHYWKNIIVIEIFTNDEIVNFLDRNEFGYSNNIILKADLLSSNEYFDTLNIEEAKYLIKSEFVEAFAKIFEKTSFNIEDYIGIVVNTEIKTIKTNGEYFREKIYEVKLMFCRYYDLINELKTFIFWVILFVSVSSILFWYF